MLQIWVKFHSVLYRQIHKNDVLHIQSKECLRCLRFKTCLPEVIETFDVNLVWSLGLNVFPVCEYNRFSGTYFLGVAPERFENNNQFWKNQVQKYWSFLGVEKTSIRNIMDMNANYGGFAAALSSDPVWIMNIVPHTMTNTLPVIYDRGLLGSYHDWLVLLPNLWINFHFSFLNWNHSIFMLQVWAILNIS